MSKTIPSIGVTKVNIPLFLLRFGAYIRKTAIFAYFSKIDGIVAAHWNIFRKNLFYKMGLIWHEEK